MLPNADRASSTMASKLSQLDRMQEFRSQYLWPPNRCRIMFYILLTFGFSIVDRSFGRTSLRSLHILRHSVTMKAQRRSTISSCPSQIDAQYANKQICSGTRLTPASQNRLQWSGIGLYTVDFSNSKRYVAASIVKSSHALALGG